MKTKKLIIWMMCLIMVFGSTMAVNAISKTETITGYKCTSSLYFTDTHVVASFTAEVQDYEYQLPEEVLSCSVNGYVYDYIYEDRAVQTIGASGGSSCTSERNVAGLYPGRAEVDYYFLGSYVRSLTAYY
ncbi:MAG: hypothetical protein IJ315_03070 [Firmicutes bacterium]|nr:hypothetical protein [Bacillota bacterium]